MKHPQIIKMDAGKRTSKFHVCISQATFLRQSEYQISQARNIELSCIISKECS